LNVFLFIILIVLEINLLLIKLPKKEPVPTAKTKKVIIHNPKVFIGYLGAKINGAIIKKDHKEEKKTGGDNHEKFSFLKITVNTIMRVSGNIFDIDILFTKNRNECF
tara:strand:+ start:305 stop:625 length:321 start_codon:yes stop_codon:yes gene_type:complete